MDLVYDDSQNKQLKLLCNYFKNKGLSSQYDLARQIAINHQQAIYEIKVYNWHCKQFVELFTMYLENVFMLANCKQ